MENRWPLLLLIVALLQAGAMGYEILQPTNTETLIKSNTFDGNHDLTVAEFRFDFNDDLYVQGSAPCASGLCSLTADGRSNDPCFPVACDFTLKGDDCGKPAAPECEAICAAQRPALCPEIQDWVVLEIDVESPLFSTSNLINTAMEFRFNWDLICHPLMLEVISMTGESYARISATSASFDDNSPDLCMFTSVPATRTTLCPSNERCYRYGTYFGFLSSYHLDGEATVIIRSVPIENITEPRLVPPADSPPSYYPTDDPFDLMNIPVFLGVPYRATYVGTDSAKPFVLHTSYCGFLHVQAEIIDYAVNYEDLLVFASTKAPFPSDILSDWITVVHGQFAPIYVCPSTDDGLVSVWFLVARSDSIGSTLEIYFTVDTDRPSLPRLPARKLGAFDPSFSNYTTFPPYPSWFGWASGAFKLNCQTPSSFPSNSSYGCMIGCVVFGCCRDAFPAYPSFPVNNSLTLMPTPWRMRSDPRYQYVSANYSTTAAAARRFSMVLFLSQTFDGQKTDGVLGSDWAQWLPTCELQADLSSIGTLDGRWLGASTFKPTPVTPTCNYDDFYAIGEQLNELSTLLSEATTALETSTLRYQADMLTLSDGWLGCFDYTETTLLNSSEAPRSASSTTICPSYNASDPCCNSQLWTECCVPRSLDYSINEYTPDTLAIDQCQNPRCDLPLASTFAFNQEYVESRSCSASTDSAAVVSAALMTHRTCLEAFYGSDTEGMTCYADSACPANQQCDLFNHRCVATNETIGDFYSCLEAGIGSNVRIALINFNEWSSLIEERSFVELLSDKYTTEELCMSVNFGHPYSPLRIVFPVTTSFPSCATCPDTGLDQTYIPPPWCGNRGTIGGSCLYTFTPDVRNDFPSKCAETDTVCNWNAALTGTACTNPSSISTGTTTQFCGVCESDTSCVEVQAASESDCINIGEVCVLSDGTVDASLTAEQCASEYRCSQACNGGACTSEDACTSIGYCEDGEQIFSLLAATSWATTHSGLGFCTFPMKPYNTPDCSSIYAGSNPSSFGCVVFGDCISSSLVDFCVVNYDTEASCTTAKGTWYPRPATQAQCNDPVLCWAPLLQGIGGLSLTYYNFLVDNDSCESCGGVRRSVNTWVPGEWHSGVMRPVVWTDRSIVSPYGFNPSVDLASLVYDLNSAALLSTRAQSLNNLQCTYNTLKRSALKLTCDCLTDGAPSDCFSIQQDGVLGQGSLCPKTTSTIEAPPIVIQTTASDFSSSLVNSCVECTLTTTLLPAFDPEPLVSVTIAFAQLRQKANRGSYRSVQNENLAIVGQAIGDAVKIEFDSSSAVSESLRSFSVCMTLSTYVSPDTDRYPVYDFGRPLSDYTVRPLDIAVVHYPESNTLCGNITYGQRGDSVELIPIVRYASFRDINGPKLTEGEKACLIVIGSLFSLAFVILVVQSLRVVFSEGFEWSRNTNLLWPCFGLLLLIRAIYLFLVAKEVLNLPSSHQLVDYFMMDFPMILYLLANLLIGLSFVFIQQGNKDLPKLYFWVAFGLLGFLVIMLFISTLLAYRYQVLNEPPISGPLLCPIIYDSTSTARTIRLIYESIILFIAVLIGLTVLIMGTSVWHKMKEVYSAGRILILCIVASLGIISDSVAFLIYYIVNDPHPYFSIVLIFTEILPISFVVVQLSMTQIQQSSESSHGSRRYMSGESSRH